MSQIKVDTITDEAGTGAPDFPNGLTGDGSGLTNLPAGNLTGALPALDGSALTSLATPVAAALNASGSAPIYACRAWVNFDGGAGGVIRSSGNVSSVSRTGTGAYTINFSAAMPNNVYSWAYGAVNNSLVSTANTVLSKTTTSISVTNVRANTGAAQDAIECTMNIFA